MKDALRQLLTQTDAALPAPAGAPDLALRVLARRRRQSRRRRMATGVASLLVGVGIAIFALVHWRPAPPRISQPVAHPATNPSSDDLRGQLARIRTDVQFQSALIDRMLICERQSAMGARLRAEQSRPDVIAEIDAQRDDAARLLIRHAQRLIAQPASRPAGMEALREVIDLFPKSTWAGVARQKLTQLEPSHS